MMKIAFSLLLFLACIVKIQAQQNNLDYFLIQAKTHSPLLKDLDGQVLSYSLDSQLIRAALKPQVNGISTNNYAPIIHGFGYDDAITNGAQLSAQVQVSKEIFSKRTIAERIRSLQIQSSAVGNSRKISEQDLQRAITDQYILTYGEQLQIDFSSHITRLLKSEDSILRRLTQRNVYRQTDYLSFAVVLQQQLLNASQLDIQYVNDYMTLNFLAGITDTLTPALEEPLLPSSPISDFTHSVFYRQFELDSLKLLNDRSLLDLSYRPKINVFADAGYNSSLAYRPYKNFGTSAGVNIIVPIYDGKQKKLQYSKIDIQEMTRASRQDFFIRQHQQEVMQLQQQLRSTDKLIGQVDKQIKYTETLIAASEKLLATGDLRLTDFILTLNNYFTAKNLLTQNYVSRLKILNQLHYWDR